jgi:hypothetical protein
MFCMFWSHSSYQVLTLWFQMVFFCLEISAWVGTFQKQRMNTAVMVTFARCLSTLYTFLFPLHAKAFPVFGKKWKLDLSLLKVLIGSLKMSSYFSCSKTSSTFWSLIIAKRKMCYVGKHWLPKKSTVGNSLFAIFWYLPYLVWHWERLEFTSISGQHRKTAEECLKSSISRHIMFKRCFSGFQLGIH